MELTIQQTSRLKTIAILMMLFLHLFNRDYQGLFEPLIFIGKQPLSYYLSLFSDACVPIFCFVSGYGLYFKYQKKPQTYLKDNIKRIGKLYINYWIILLLFVIGLGAVLGQKEYIGGLFRFVLNFLALDNSYNGAWWFFFTYILLVSTSSFFFRPLKKNYWALLLIFSLIFYLISFYFRIYKPNIFDYSFLNWVQRQTVLFGTSFLPFIAGAIIQRSEWKINTDKYKISYKNIFWNIIIILLIVIHGIIPNLIIAPFTAILFIFAFIQINFHERINRLLDFLSPHSTNLWLIHMFFYSIYFKNFIYSPKYVLLIFGLLVVCCYLSSCVVNRINKYVLKTL